MVEQVPVIWVLPVQVHVWTPLTVAQLEPVHPANVHAVVPGLAHVLHVVPVQLSPDDVPHLHSRARHGPTAAHVLHASPPQVSVLLKQLSEFHAQFVFLPVHPPDAVHVSHVVPGHCELEL